MTSRRTDPRPPSPGGRFRRHEIALPDGGRLRLVPDGTIARIAADGSVAESWAVEAEGWAEQALRFGIHPDRPTIAPRRGGDEDSKPRA